MAEAELSAWHSRSADFLPTKTLLGWVVALSTILMSLPQVLEPRKANQAGAQKQEQKETDQIRLESPLVNVDALVTDRRGRFVEGLAPEDFQVFIDGKSRPIVNFSLIRRSAEAGRAKLEKPMAIPESQRESVAMSYFLILFDLCFTDQADLRPIADAAKEFVSKQATADDRIMVAAFDGSLKVLADFTDRKDELQRAIDRAVQSIGCKGPHIPSERQALWRDPEVEVLAKMRPLEMPTQVVVGRGEEATIRSIVGLFNRVNEMTSAKATSFFQALLQAVKQLAETPGMRTLTVCSSGFPSVIGLPEILSIGNWGFSTMDLTPYLNAVTAAANVMQVRIFMIDPSGLRPLIPSSDLSISPGQTWRDISKGGQVLQALAQSLYALHSRNMMAYLAEATSGQLTTDTNDLLWGFHLAKEATMAYYSLGVLPLEPREPGKLHVIRLRVKRPDVHIRYRRNYFDSAPSADVKALSRMENARLRLIDPEEHLRRAVFHPEIFISVPVRLTGYSYDVATSLLLLNIQIPVVRGHFEFASGGSTLVIYGVLLDPQDRSTVDEFSVTVGLGRRKIHKSIDIQQSVVVKPGRYLLHLVVMEKETERLGGIRQELRVGT